jgi:hypothetical protein
MTNSVDEVLCIINDMVEFEKDLMHKYENLVMLHSIHDNYDEKCAELLRKHSYALDVLIGLKRLISKHKE